MTGVAELFTGDSGMVAWADLQYVVFTLITLVCFAAPMPGFIMLGWQRCGSTKSS